MAEQIGEDIKRALNPSQWEAVSYNDGPSLVIAGAGSGKTRVLTYKIAYLLEKGVDYRRILALTFTNKAAREMVERIRHQVSARVRVPQDLKAGTFHSIFSRLLRKNAGLLGYSSNFTIYDTGDSKSLIKKIIKEHGLDEKKYKSSLVAARISDAKNSLLLPEGYASSTELMKRDMRDGVPAVSKLYSIYMQRCRQANCMDFDDLLLNMYRLLKDNPDICHEYQETFEYILIDEYQDTNMAQYQIIRLLAPANAKLCVVGDDAQSIYGFRGAQIGNILNFQRDYPTTKLIKLEQNYRSTQTIVSAANSIIEHNRGRIPKTIFSKNEVGEKIKILSAHSDREESMKIVRQVKKLISNKSFSINQIAVLYRTNAQSRTLEDGFRDAAIPYHVYGGQSFYQRKEIKDAIAYLRLVVNPNDEEALLRVINYPTRGIGNTTIQKLQSAASANSVSLWRVLENPQMFSVNLSKRTLNSLLGFANLIEDYRKRDHTEGAYDIAFGLIRDSGIMSEMMSDATPENLSRQENIEEMLNAIRDFETDIREEEGKDVVRLVDYLARVALITDQDEREDSGQRVTLMTIHAAKGLEYEVVFVTGMEDDLFPNANAKFYPSEIEEERRLFYVAMTRAKKLLYLTYARQRYKFGKMEFCQPSPFLDEIAPQYLQSEDISGRRGQLSLGTPQKSWGGKGANVHAAKVQTGVFSTVSTSKLKKLKDVTSSGSHPSGASLPLVSVSVGQHIEHERFGFGEVIAVEGEGVSTKVTVSFENAGTKNLLLKFAKFKILD